MRVQVRELKRELFATGAVSVDIDGFSSVSVEQPEFEQTQGVRYFVHQFEGSVKKALNGAGVGNKNFLQTHELNVVVFTGGGGALPPLRRIFSRAIGLDEGAAHFETVDPIPDWAGNYGPDVQLAFPQLAVSTGGCAPNLPDEKSSVLDTSTAGGRSLAPMYR